MFSDSSTQCLCYNCFQEREALEGPCPYCGFDLAENEKKFPVALRAGTVLNDRYIVGRVLGQGGFGITYLALDTQLNAKVAIKEFMPGEIATRVGGTTVSVMMDTKSEEFAYGAERFQEEARTLAKFIGNPNIAGVSSYFDENDTSYFVMDYIEGISFKTYIANHGGKISVEEALNVMIPVLRALTAVHQEGFIHRDVTPDNIYITKDGIVKLLDFGSARYSIGDKSKSLDVILKVGYAPKEQYIRRSRQGPFTDVYSCAACFYAAITGFLPPESLERLDHDELVPISQCGIAIPEYLDKAILKGLAVQPEDRFQNAQEFLDAIESQQVVEVPGKAPAAPTAGGQLDALITKVKQKPKFYGAIAAAAVVVLVALSALTGGGDGGSSLAESLAPTLTIAGQQVSAAEEFLELTEGAFTDADVETMHQMTNLRRIYLDGVTIETDGLDWVEEFPHLTEFSCQGYTESELDLTPFAGLKDLTRLSFYQNGNLTAPAGDLSPLAELTELTRLDLCIDYEVKDLSPLAGMTRLESVQIYGNNNNGNGSGLTDISALAGMTELTSLRIDLGDVRDFSPLAGMTQLQELRVYGSFLVDDLSFLRNLTELRTLDLAGNYESSSLQEDLTALSGLVNLTELRLDVPVASLHGLEPLVNLRSLEMYGGSGSTYTDVDALAGLTELVTLYLPYRSYNYENPPKPINLDGLANLTKLQSLEINDGVESLEPLRNLTELRDLRIRANNNEDIELDLSPLTNLAKLTSLDIYGNIAGGDLSDLSGLTELRSLSISHYDRNYDRYEDRVVIRDLSPLASLTNLSTLSVSGTAEGIDTSPVSFVPSLDIN